jgi:hypothetical protein
MNCNYFIPNIISWLIHKQNPYAASSALVAMKCRVMEVVNKVKIHPA